MVLSSSHATGEPVPLSISLPLDFPLVSFLLPQLSDGFKEVMFLLIIQPFPVLSVTISWKISTSKVEVRNQVLS